MAGGLIVFVKVTLDITGSQSTGKRRHGINGREGLRPADRSSAGSAGGNWRITAQLIAAHQPGSSDDQRSNSSLVRWGTCRMRCWRTRLRRASKPINTRTLPELTSSIAWGHRFSFDAEEAARLTTVPVGAKSINRLQLGVSIPGKRQSLDIVGPSSLRGWHHASFGAADDGQLAWLPTGLSVVAEETHAENWFNRQTRSAEIRAR